MILSHNQAALFCMAPKDLLEVDAGGRCSRINSVVETQNNYFVWECTHLHNMDFVWDPAIPCCHRGLEPVVTCVMSSARMSQRTPVYPESWPAAAPAWTWALSIAFKLLGSTSGSAVHRRAPMSTVQQLLKNPLLTFFITLIQSKLHHAVLHGEVIWSMWKSQEALLGGLLGSSFVMFIALCDQCAQLDLNKL